MSRPIFVGNGAMLVGLDKVGQVRDFYYPYVGLENHTSRHDLHHRLGVWVDGKLSWLEDKGWSIELDYEGEGLIGVTRAEHQEFNLMLESHDFVDSELNVFSRRITIKNLSDTARDVRLFVSQVFRIGDSQRDDTALYLPEEQAVMHYKGRRIFLVGGESQQADSFDQYAIGLHGMEGHVGTYVDAQDGELSGNSVEHGFVDSTVRFKLDIEANGSSTVDYWVAVGTTRADAIKAHKSYRGEQLIKHLEMTRDHWRDWLKIADLDKVDDKFKQSAIKSLFIVKSHIDRRGSVLASGDSEMLNYARDYYSYSWPRDAVFALWPLIRLGYVKEAQNFFNFVRDILQPDGYLMHKYQPDRAIGSSWHPYVRNGREELPIQEDETAGVVFLLHEYLKNTGDTDFVQGLYETLVQPAANFMDSYVDSSTKLPHASYDLWEEKFLTTTYTTALVYASLMAAASLADKFEYPDDAIRWRSVADDIRASAHDTFFCQKTNYFYKGFIVSESGMLEYDNTIDSSSLYGAAMFGLYDFDDPLVQKAAKTLEETLIDKSSAGGIPRYAGDLYHNADKESLGNPWFVTSLWYAQFLLQNGDSDKARDIAVWAQRQMLPSGVLSEQILAQNGQPVSVAPLTWSSAEFINTVLDLSKV